MDRLGQISDCNAIPSRQRHEQDDSSVVGVRASYRVLETNKGMPCAMGYRSQLHDSRASDLVVRASIRGFKWCGVGAR